VPRYIQELQDALQSFIGFQSTGDNREGPTPEQDAITSTQGELSVSAQSEVSRQPASGEFIDVVRPVALPDWIRPLFESPLQLDQDIALTIVAQYVVHAGLTQHERQHPEQGIRAAQECLARLAVVGVHKREAVLKAIEVELARRRSDVFSEEIRLESEARASFDRIIEHTFFSVEETLPGLELFGRTHAQPGELHTQYIENAQKTVDLLCEEALARAAAGEEISTRYLAAYAGVILEGASSADGLVSHGDLLVQLEKRYLEGLRALYEERFPIESLHRLDLSLSQCKNLEEAFAILSKAVPGGDRQVFSTYALSTLNGIAASQNHDVGLLVGRAATFGFSIDGQAVSSLGIALPEDLKKRCNEDRILEHARSYTGFAAAGVSSEVQLGVPQPLVSDRLKSLVLNVRGPAAGYALQGLLPSGSGAGQIQSEKQRSSGGTRDGRTNINLNRLSDSGRATAEQVQHLEFSPRMQGLQFDSTRAQNLGSQVQAFQLQIDSPKEGVPTPHIKPEEFLVRQLSSFVKDKEAAPLREYVKSLVHSVEWVQFEFEPSVEPSVNPFTSKGGQLEALGLSTSVGQRLPIESNGLQLLQPDSLQNPLRSRGEVGPSALTRGYATLALDAFERRVRQECGRALQQRDLFKLEEFLQVVSEVEPSLRAIGGQGDEATSLYRKLTHDIQAEFVKDAKALPKEGSATYRALGLGFKNNLCDQQQVASSLRHLSQCSDLPALLHQIAEGGLQIQDLRTVHDTPATPTSVEIARTSRLQSLRNETGLVDGTRTFFIETESRLEQGTVLGPADSPRVVIASHTTVADLCRALFHTREPMPSDLHILATLNPELAAAKGGEPLSPDTKVQTGAILRVTGTPLGLKIQQAAAADTVRRLREELRVCVDADERSRIEYNVHVSEVFDSFVQREGKMLAIQRGIDQCSMEIDAASSIAPGNAQRLADITKQALPKLRDDLLAERKRLIEVESSLTARLERLKSKGLPDDTPLLELSKGELEAVARYRAALSGSGAQDEAQRNVHRSPAAALAEVAVLAEERTQEYQLLVQEEISRLDTVARSAASSTENGQSAEPHRLNSEKAAALAAASRSSTAVANILLSLADVSTGTHASDADLMLRRVSLVLVSAGERELAQSGLTPEGLKSAADRFFGAGRALEHASRLPGHDSAAKSEIQRAAGEMFAKGYEYRATATQDADSAVRDLGRALSWLVTNGEGEAETFSFLKADKTTPRYLDSSGDVSSEGLTTTKIAALQSVEVERLASHIAVLPESRRTRALELLAQVVDRHSARFEEMARDGSAVNSRDAAYRALQVAKEVPTQAVPELPQLVEAIRRIEQQVQRGELTEEQAGAALLTERAQILLNNQTFPYDSECSIIAHGARARFLLAFGDSSSTENAIDSELESIRREFRSPRGARGRSVADVSAELEVARSQPSSTSDAVLLARLERELVEAQVREARLETLAARMDGLALSALTQLAANTKSSSREKFAEQVVQLVEEAIARDEACFREQSARMMHAQDTQREGALQSVHRGMRQRHADMFLRTVHAYSAAGRFDLAEKQLTQLESRFAEAMSPATSKVVKDVRERHAKGESWSAVFAAALNEAQAGGSMTQSVGLAASGALTGAAIGSFFFGVGAPVGAVIGGVVGLVADKGTNVIRGRSRIGAAFSSGVSGVDGSQTGLNMLTLGVDVVTVWIPLRGAGRVVSKVGFGGLARGTLSSEAKVAFSSQLSRMFAEAGVTSARELGEQGVAQVASRMMRHEMLRGLGEHGGTILAGQVGTAGGVYGYNRLSIEFNDSLSKEQKEIALKHLNQEAMVHGGILLAMLGVGGALGHQSNRSWSNRVGKLADVAKLRGQEQAVSRAVIERWGANLRPAAVGSGATVASGAASSQEALSATRVEKGTKALTTGSSTVKEPTAIPDRKIFGVDAAKALAELAKDPALQNPRVKEVCNRLFKRFEGRAGALSDCYLLESELNAARAGRLAANPDIPPPGGDSFGGGSGGNDRGPSRPGDGGQEGGSGGDHGELVEVGDEFQWYSDDLRELLRGGSAQRTGSVQNSLGSSGPRGGSAAVMDRPVKTMPRVTESASGARVRSTEVVKPSTSQAPTTGNASASSQAGIVNLDAPAAPMGTRVESAQLVRPLIETAPSLVTERLGATAVDSPFYKGGEIADASLLARASALVGSQPKIYSPSAPLLQPESASSIELDRSILSDQMLRTRPDKSSGTAEPMISDVEVEPLPRTVTPKLPNRGEKIEIPALQNDLSVGQIPELSPTDTTITRETSTTGLELPQIAPSDVGFVDPLRSNVPRIASQARTERPTDLPEASVPSVLSSRPPVSVPGGSASKIEIPSETTSLSSEELAEIAAADTSITRGASTTGLELSQIAASDLGSVDPLRSNVPRIASQVKPERSIGLPEQSDSSPLSLRHPLSTPSGTTSKIPIPSETTSVSSEELAEVTAADTTITRGASTTGLELSQIAASEVGYADPLRSNVPRIASQLRTESPTDLPAVSVPSVLSSRPPVSVPGITASKIQIPSEATSLSSNEVAEIAAADTTITRAASTTGLELSQIVASDVGYADPLRSNVPRISPQVSAERSIDLPEESAPSPLSSRPPVLVPGVAASKIQIPSEATSLVSEQLAGIAAADTTITRGASATGLELSQMAVSEVGFADPLRSNVPRIASQARTERPTDLPEQSDPSPLLSGRPLSAPSVAASKIQIPSEATSLVSEELAEIAVADTTITRGASATGLELSQMAVSEVGFVDPLRSNLPRIASQPRIKEPIDLPEESDPSVLSSHRPPSAPRAVASKIQVPSETTSLSSEELAEIIGADTTIARGAVSTRIEPSRVEASEVNFPDPLRSNIPRIASQARTERPIDLPEGDAPSPLSSHRPLSTPSVVASKIQISSGAASLASQERVEIPAADTALARQPASMGIELSQPNLVPNGITVGLLTPTEFPQTSPRPEIAPAIPSTVSVAPQAVPVRDVDKRVRPLPVPVPQLELTRRSATDSEYQRSPQPKPEPQPARQHMAQATDQQEKKKEELDYGAGSDIPRREEKRKDEERRSTLLQTEERAKKKDKRRTGRRVARRVVAGEIGSFTVDEDQRTEYDNKQFTNSRLRTNEGGES
jgi:hypothetical protein